MRPPRPRMLDRQPGRRSAAGGGAFTLIETVMSLLVVGLMLVATLNTIGAARTARFKHARHCRALLLAQDLLTEILQHPYWDPIAQSGLGPSYSEAATGNRSRFNDVDDYHGWSASPPQHRDGSVIDQADGYGRQVKVTWSRPDNLIVGESAETGIKRIVVTVTHQGRTVIRLRAIRTKAWQDPLDD